MNKKEIMDNYAQEQGYEDWIHLICTYVFESSDGIIEHINKVIDLIQEELKKKIANEQDLEGIQHIILNTPNL